MDVPSRKTLPRLALQGAVAVVLLTCTGEASAQSKKRTPTPTPPKPRGDLTEGLGLSSPSNLPEIVATIDGDPVRREDLERTFKTLLAANGRNPVELSDADRKKGYRSVLEEMVADRLLARQSAAEKIDDIDVEKRYDAARQGFANQEAFVTELKRTGQTPEQIKENVRRQLRQQHWIDGKIADQIKVTPEEAEKFYQANPERFNLPEMVRASHILLAVRRDAPPENALEKETLANSLEERLKQGEKFDDLARQYSDDPNAKQTGGDLDFFGRDRIMPEFAEAAFKLKLGEVSPPVRTQFGFHIIKLTDHRDPRTATLDEARPQIMAFLGETKRQQAVNDLLTNLRANAKVEIKIP